jgi:integration host factor subunit beta
MNKSDLIAELAEKENMTEAKATEIINLIFDGLRDALQNEGRIEIRGVGSFSIREYKAYTGRNPKSGGKIQVKPKRSPYFKVGRELKERVDGI